MSKRMKKCPLKYREQSIDVFPWYYCHQCPYFQLETIFCYLTIEGVIFLLSDILKDLSRKENEDFLNSMPSYSTTVLRDYTG